MALSLLLAVAVGLQTAKLIWWAIPQPTTWEPMPPPPSASAAATTKVSVQALVDAALFGTADDDAPAQAAITDAPDTTLNLRLMGIFSGRDATDSRALIHPGTGEEAPYSIGMEVVRGVKLEAIFPDRVILMRNGRAETLRLDKDAPSRAVVADTSTPSAQNMAGNIALPQLASVREQILQDPSQAANFLRVQPAAVDGAMRGYRIYPGRDRSLFNAAGLRPGDLVTAINGTDLNDATRALQMLTELSTATSVSLTVERGGNAQTVNISLN